MKEKLKIVPFIDTNKTIKYENYLREKFDSHKLLGNQESLIEKWTLLLDTKDVVQYKLNDITLEFRNDKYIINDSILLPTPTTINDFVNDMKRLNIQIYWDDKVFDYFYPKDILPANRIEEFYRKMLHIMDKDYELL